MRKIFNIIYGMQKVSVCGALVSFFTGILLNLLVHDNTVLLTTLVITAVENTAFAISGILISGYQAYLILQNGKKEIRFWVAMVFYMMLAVLNVGIAGFCILGLIAD